MINMPKKILEILKYWIPIAIAITGLSALVYLAVQQDIRQSANDPQIQMAEDAALALTNGAEPNLILPKGLIDLSTSTYPYMVIFNDQGQPIAASAWLYGHMPTLPVGVFAFTKKYGQDRFTWQPRAGVRSAVVVVHYNGQNPGFVLAGRSLREVEIREDRLFLEVLALWLFTLVCTLGSVIILSYPEVFRK
jgi:hypothetical protein